MSHTSTSAAAVLLWCQCIFIGTATRVTNLTFVPQELTWNDARMACHHMGGHLVEILDETKNNVILNFAQKYKASLAGLGAVSIGLATLTPLSWDHHWSERCLPLSWANWDPDHMLSPSMRASCVKFNRGTGLWLRRHCDQPQQYACEQTVGEKCPYQPQPNNSLLADNDVFTISTFYVNNSQCADICDKNTSNDGVECWAFHFTSVTQKCTIFYTTHPYLSSDDQFLQTNTEGTLYIKQCYNGQVGEPYNLTTLPNTEKEPQFNCANLSASAISTELTQSAETATQVVISPTHSDPTFGSSEITTTTKETVSELLTSTFLASTTVLIQSYDGAQIALTTTSTFSSGDIRVSGTHHSSLVTTGQHWTGPVLSTDPTQTPQASFTTAPRHSFPDIRTSGTGYESFVTTEQGWTAPVWSTNLIQPSYEIPEASLSTSRIFSSADQTEQGWTPPVSFTSMMEDIDDSLPTSFTTFVDIEPQTFFAVTQQPWPNGTACLSSSSSKTEEEAASFTLPAVNLFSSLYSPVIEEMETSEALLPYSTAGGRTLSQICYCSCSTLVPVVNSMNKQKFLEGLLVKLELNKTQLSSYRRKCVSISDERPLSVGLGYFGVIIVVCFFILIILFDVTRVPSNLNSRNFFPAQTSEKKDRV